MSIKAMVHYLDRLDLKGNKKLCMVILGDYANDEGECFPGHIRIAQRLSMGDSGTRRLLYALRDEGELEIMNAKGVITKTGATNRYRLLSFIAESMGVTHVTPDSTRVSRSDSKGVISKRQGCHKGDTDPSVLDPSVDPSDLIGTATPVQPPLIDGPFLCDRPQPETPKERDKRLSAHPAVVAYRENYHRSMRKVTYESVQHVDNIEKWKSVMYTWKLRGYNPYNIDGQLNWYSDGIPKGGPKGVKVDTSISSEWEVPDMSEQDRAEADAAMAILRGLT